MFPEDLARVRVPSDPQVHPDGSRVAFTLSRPDFENDRYERTIWLADPEGSRPFTSGPGDTMPRWSPDGRRLAFARLGADLRPQLFVMPADGGEARPIAEFDLGIEAIRWSPDGHRIAVVAITWEEEWRDLSEEERKRRPQRIRSFPYRFDFMGMLFDRRRHIWLVDPAGEAPARCLTPGSFDEEFPAWSPDGEKIAFLSDRDGGLTLGNDAWEVDVASGEVTQLGSRGLWNFVSYRPDGVPHLLGVGSPTWPAVVSLHRVEADGSLTSITGHLDRSAMSLAAGPPSIEWDGTRAIVGHEDGGTFGLVAVDHDGSVEVLAGGERVVTGFSSMGGRLAFTASSQSNTGDVFAVADGAETRLTDFGGALDLVEADHFRAGEIDVWVHVPEGHDPVPVLLVIHGGPASQYGFGFFDEFQIYVGAGFGVVACNPRGSSGRGLEFLRDVVGEGWGVVDTEDVLEALDAALARHSRLDSNRIGVMGGSYGGFLTAWLTARENRFRSAVVERALLSFPSFAGTSDIGHSFPASYTDADYPDGWAAWWEKSPLALAHQVSTPTLIIHSEEDFRCPIEQAEQYFMALLRNGTEVEFLRFPGEGHEMSRSGTPRHRLERFEAVLDWHRRHLTA